MSCSKWCISTAIIIVGKTLSAQDSLPSKSITISAFIDVYYSYDFNKPVNHTKPAFLYNHNRHNEVAVNLALVNFAYKHERYRAGLGLMTGTYPQANLASEPELLRNIYEASVGLKLSAKKGFWLDAGIFPSHIGFETAISKDCRTLTRSILAENSPYYEAGLKLSYKTNNDKWYVAALMLNGWQRIKRVDGNNSPALGIQLTFNSLRGITINSSSFIGNDKPDSIRRWRYFHNLYATWQMSKAWEVIIGFDVGVEQIKKGSGDFNTWYAPVMIVQFKKSDWAFAARAEYYSDQKGVIVSLKNTSPFQMRGYSLNIDRLFNKNVLWRVEAKWFNNSVPYFERDSKLVRTNTSITTSLSFTIDGLIRSIKGVK